MNPETPTARSTRKSAGRQNLFKLLLAAIILILVNFLGFKHYTHKDLSTSQFFALSPKSKDVLAKLDGPLHIYALLSDDATVVGRNEAIEKLINEYIDANKNVTYEKIDPAYDPERAKKLMDQLHFDPNTEVIVVQYKDHTPRYVRVAELFETNPMTGGPGAFKGEQQLTGTILALIEGKSSKVYFTDGHGERNINDAMPQSRGLGVAASLLKDDNIQATTINLAQHGEVPADADALVIAGPSIPLAPVEVTAIDHYLANNGKLMILLDPYYTSGLEELLAKYGLKFEDDLALHQYATSVGGSITYPLVQITQGGFGAQPITAKLAQSGLQMLVQNARSLSLPPASGPTPSKTQFLLQTDAESWGWISRGGSPPADPKTLSYNKVTDIGGPLTIGAQFDGGMTTDPKTKATIPGTRIVAVGFASTFENAAIKDVSANFFLNAVDWLAKKDAVMDIAPKKPAEYGVSLSPLSFTTLAWTTCVVIPGAALLVGLLIWFSRRK